MAEYSNTAVIAYPAEYPSGPGGMAEFPNVEELHSTIIFLGDIDEDLGGMPKQTLIAMLDSVDTNMFRYVDTKGWELFGEDNDIPVILLKENDHLLQTRREIERSLNAHGIKSASEFDYRPHVTVDMDSYNRNIMPRWVLLRPAMLWYGDDRDVIGNAREAGYA